MDFLTVGVVAAGRKPAPTIVRMTTGVWALPPNST